MKLLITGGAGFIGSNFIIYMTKKYPDYEIVCLDKLTYAGKRENLDQVVENPKFKFVQGDICDKELVDQIFDEEKFDVVVNFAAESHVDRSIDNPAVFLETNINGTAVLMDTSLKYGVKRYHQVSTDEVYGDLPLDRLDLSFSENSQIRPSSPYSASKAAGDMLALAYHRTYNLPVTISRSSNNYGPRQLTEKLIPLTIVNAIYEKALPVYGNGLNVRDWIYVDDHCGAIDLIIHKGMVGEIYNIGANNEVKNIDIVTKICDKLKKSRDLITYVEDRKGHDLRYAINAEKIRKELGWKPATAFDDGLAKTIEWYEKRYVRKNSVNDKK